MTEGRSADHLHVRLCIPGKINRRPPWSEILRGSVICLVVAFELFLPHRGFALSDYNPTGVFGQSIRSWKPEWSRAFFMCADNEPKVSSLVKIVQSGRLRDVGQQRPWCPAGDLSDPAHARLFLLATFKALAQPESHYRERTVYPYGPNGPVIGLMQIGLHDARRHDCKKPNGSRIYSAEELKDGGNNLCCALRIASNVATSSNPFLKKHQNYFATGKTGIMAAFWQPMRQGGGGDGRGGYVNDTRNSNEIKRKVAGICSQMNNDTLARSFSPTELQLANYRTSIKEKNTLVRQPALNYSPRTDYPARVQATRPLLVEGEEVGGYSKPVVERPTLVN